MLATILLVVPALAQEPACPAPTHGELMAATRDAEQAFRDAAPERIAAAAQAARYALPCTGTRLLPEEAAAVHRLFAYDAFVRRDTRATQDWFEASRAASPKSSLPADVFAERHPLQGIFSLAAPRSRETLALSSRRGQEVWVDGQAQKQLAAGRPAIVQVVTATGVETELAVDGSVPSALQGRPERVADHDGGRSRTMLSVGVSGITANHDQGPWGYGGPQLRVHLPLARSVYAEALAQLPLTSAEVTDGEGTSTAVMGMPMAQIGIAGRARGDGLVPWASGGVLLLSDVDGLMAGAGVGVGVDLPVGPLQLTPDLRGGWTTGPRLGGMPLLGLGLGVGVAL